MGRLVKTHSTYIEGLIKKLKVISRNNLIQTITPGVIGHTKGKEEKLTIKISRKIEGGYKLIARKGKSYQEIFIITKIDKKTLEELVK
tara:strand:+ start:1134 stop:1397 length:264 start_codon:yes stop_codon:yes gene_type:complete